MDYVIVVAAGAGTRLGSSVPKALIEIAGAPLVSWSVRALGRHPAVAGIVIAAPGGYEAQIEQAAAGCADCPITVVTGGESRQHSVRAALAVVPANATRIAVHDAARPLVSADMLGRAFGACERAAGAVVGSPVADTIKQADATGTIIATVPREDLWRAETPQAFRADVLRRAIGSADDETLAHATDDASLVEALGEQLVLVDSRGPNLNVTTAADAVIVSALLRAGVQDDGSGRGQARAT